MQFHDSKNQYTIALEVKPLLDSHLVHVSLYVCVCLYRSLTYARFVTRLAHLVIDGERFTLQRQNSQWLRALLTNTSLVYSKYCECIILVGTLFLSCKHYHPLI